MIRDQKQTVLFLFLAWSQEKSVQWIYNFNLYQSYYILVLCIYIEHLHKPWKLKSELVYRTILQFAYVSGNSTGLFFILLCRETMYSS